MPKHRINHVRQLTTWPQCSGKNSYPTRQDAERVKAEQEIIDPNLHLDIYPCLHGRHWHLTRHGGVDKYTY